MRVQNDERGTGGIEGLAFGVLVFVFGTLVITNAWGVIDTKLAASAAAREAARAYVEAPSPGAAEADARAAAQASMEGHGHPMSNITLAGAGFQRCGVVEVRVTSTLPRVALPLTGGTGGHYRVSAAHREVIDPYRSGLSGPARCS